MGAVTDKAHCFICNQETNTYECKGCSEHFCSKHLAQHHEKINQQFDKIKDDCSSFLKTVIDQKDDPKKRPLIQQINQWEDDSINKIKQTANECRRKLINYTNKYIIRIENKLVKLTEELKRIHQENEYNEIHLNQLKETLIKLSKEFDKPSNVAIEQNFTSFINKISVIVPCNTSWKQYGINIAGGNYQGKKLSQVSNPSGIFIDDNENIYIADHSNHRILEWKCNANNGQIVAGENEQGNKINQLNHPVDVIIDKQNNSLIIADRHNRRVIRWPCQNNTNGQIIIENIDCYGLAMDKNGYLYVSDTEKHEVRRWKIGEKNGTIVAGGNGKGNNLNQLNEPTYLFVDQDCSLYVSDCYNHRIMKWLKDALEGIVVAGGNGKGESLKQLSYPRGVIVDQIGQIYVADSDNHRIMRWFEGSEEGTIIVGGNGKGEQSDQLNNPFGLSFDREYNLYVADCGNNRIQKFEIN
ncbi:unnamed protein product [Rotaria sp. Silwood1]|nr:unnamed protein product [Rotaria sp. Silwood1]